MNQLGSTSLANLIEELRSEPDRASRAVFQKAKPLRDDHTDAITKAVDRLRKASRLVGAMAQDWMIQEEAAARRDLLRLIGIEDMR